MEPGRVALTGGIAAGKSAAAHYFADLGVPVIDTDQVAKTLATTGQEAFDLIVAHFGQNILERNGSLDRHALRARVFADEKEKKILESILHPLIRMEVLRQLMELKNNVYAIVVVPLLFEAAGFREIFHRALVVDSAIEQRKKRALQRPGMSESIFIQIDQSQLSREIRNRLADDLMDNNGALLSLQDQVQAFHRYYDNFFKKNRPLSNL